MNVAATQIALLVFVIATWGYSWVLMKIGLGYAKPLTFAAWRCAIGAVSMIIYLRARGIKWPGVRNWPDYIMVGLFQTTFMFGFMLFGMERVTAGKTSVLLYTMPVWTILLVHFYLKEKISASKWVGVLLGSAGILSILGWDAITNQSLHIMTGEMFIIIGAVSWAISNIWVKKRMTGENIYVISTLQLTFGTLGLIVIALPSQGVLSVDWTPYSIYILLFTGIIATAVDFTIWFHLLRKLDIGITTFSSLMVPVCGLLLDWLMLGNRPDWGVIIGTALILTGIYKVSGK